jgi:hypothetical protein
LITIIVFGGEYQLLCAHRVLVERPEGKRPLGRPRRRVEGNTKMDLQEVVWEA